LAFFGGNFGIFDAFLWLNWRSSTFNNFFFKGQERKIGDLQDFFFFSEVGISGMAKLKNKSNNIFLLKTTAAALACIHQLLNFIYFVKIIYNINNILP